MFYSNVITAEFILRKNRFIGLCRIEGELEEVHIANTGRGSEVFIKGAKVILSLASNSNRKTRYTLVSIYKGDRLINMDSQAPNKIAFEGLMEGKIALDCQLNRLKAEKRYHQSRFDFYYQGNHNGEDVHGFIEVKGATLEVYNKALFPDAPTLRGLRHLQELAKSLKEGYENYLIFVIQMAGVDCFMPNWPTHPEFAETLYQIQETGVKVLAYDTIVSPNNVTINQQIPIQKYPINNDIYRL